jgi:hypothetical protein
MKQDNDQIHDTHDELRQDVQGVLWYLFRSDIGPRLNVKAIAPELGICPDQLNKYINNYQPFPAYLVAALTTAAKDTTLLNWIMARCPGLKLSQQYDMPGLDGSAQDEINRTAIVLGQLIDTWDRAIKDGKLTMTERGEIMKQADRIIELMERIKRETK